MVHRLSTRGPLCFPRRSFTAWLWFVSKNRMCHLTLSTSSPGKQTLQCAHTHTHKTAWNGKNSFLPFLVVEGCEAAVTLSVQGCVNPTVCLLKGGAVVVVLPRCLRAGQVCCSLQVLFLWQGLCFSISAELYFGLDIFMEDPTCKPATPSGGLTFLVLTSKFISCLFGCSHCRLKWHRVFGFFCPYVTHISLTQPTFIHGP